MKFLITFLMMTTFSIQAKNLVLNGTGMRLATIFKVKVYEAQLYTNAKSQKAEEIIAQKGKKELMMTFKRSVGKKKIVNGFKDGLEKNKLKDIFTPIYNAIKDVKKGDKLHFEFFEDNIDFTLNSENTVRVKSEVASQYLLLWIGKVPNKELRKGLLGIK